MGYRNTMIHSPHTISVFGVTLVQTYLYYHKFPKDWMLQKVSVRVVANFSRKYFLTL